MLGIVTESVVSFVFHPICTPSSIQLSISGALRYCLRFARSCSETSPRRSSWWWPSHPFSPWRKPSA